MVSLGILWVLWCFGHSLLIIPVVADSLQGKMGRFRRYYRLLYNIIACATLCPLLVMSSLLPQELVFSWGGATAILRYTMLGLSFLLFYGGAKQYDLALFMGFSQIREDVKDTTLAAAGVFNASGVSAITRHPWYLGGLLLLWSARPVYYEKDVVISSILSLYLVLGSFWEERKLLRQYPEEYGRYMEEVSGLIPLKWLKK